MLLPAVSDHLFVKEYLVSLSYSNHKKSTNGHDDRYFKKKMGRNVAVVEIGCADMGYEPYNTYSRPSASKFWFTPTLGGD